jgi:hypothetical protein
MEDMKRRIERGDQREERIDAIEVSGSACDGLQL